MIALSLILEQMQSINQYGNLLFGNVPPTSDVSYSFWMACGAGKCFSISDSMQRGHNYIFKRLRHQQMLLWALSLCASPMFACDTTTWEFAILSSISYFMFFSISPKSFYNRLFSISKFFLYNQTFLLSPI